MDSAEWWFAPTEYFTPEKLRKVSDKQYGLEYEEALEMAYENIMVTAKEAIKGVRVKRS